MSFQVCPISDFYQKYITIVIYICIYTGHTDVIRQSAYDCSDWRTNGTVVQKAS